MNDMAKPPRSRAAKWTRRGFIGAGVLAGGALLIGVGVRSAIRLTSWAPRWPAARASS